MKIEVTAGTLLGLLTAARTATTSRLWDASSGMMGDDETPRYHDPGSLGINLSRPER
jgi:hypothetical protein